MSNHSKSVQFASSSSSNLPTPSIQPPTIPTKRRSSLKSGSVPVPLNSSTHVHSDPILRRLRLKDGKGVAVNLMKEFDNEVEVIGFLFGAKWSGRDQSAYSLVETFAERERKKLKIIFISVDQSEEDFIQNSHKKVWTSMEWNDGSNPSDSDRSDLSLTPPSEPFLLATEKDLEIDLAASDLTGSVYLRPYSRVHLAEKFGVYGIPQLVIYHLPTQKILTKHARFSKLETISASEEALERWRKGISGDYNFVDIVGSMKYTLMGALVASGYMLAVRFGGAEDVLGQLTNKFMTNYLSR